MMAKDNAGRVNVARTRQAGWRAGESLSGQQNAEVCAFRPIRSAFDPIRIWWNVRNEHLPFPRPSAAN